MLILILAIVNTYAFLWHVYYTLYFFYITILTRWSSNNLFKFYKNILHQDFKLKQFKLFIEHFTPLFILNFLSNEISCFKQNMFKMTALRRDSIIHFGNRKITSVKWWNDCLSPKFTKDFFRNSNFVTLNFDCEI